MPESELPKQPAAELADLPKAEELGIIRCLEGFQSCIDGVKSFLGATDLESRYEYLLRELEIGHSLTVSNLVLEVHDLLGRAGVSETNMTIDIILDVAKVYDLLKERYLVNIAERFFPDCEGCESVWIGDNFAKEVAVKLESLLGLMNAEVHVGEHAAWEFDNMACHILEHVAQNL